MEGDMSGGATNTSMSTDSSVGVSEEDGVWQPELMSSFSFFHHPDDRMVICCRCCPAELSPFPSDSGSAPTGTMESQCC